MVNKAELETKVLEQEKELRELRIEKIYLEGEREDILNSLKLVGRACHSVYKCYPHILGECCTEPELLRIFKMQDAFTEFLEKLKEHNNDKEMGDEI